MGTCLKDIVDEVRTVDDEEQVDILGQRIGHVDRRCVEALCSAFAQSNGGEWNLEENYTWEAYTLSTLGVVVLSAHSRNVEAPLVLLLVVVEERVGGRRSEIYLPLETVNTNEVDKKKLLIDRN